MSVSKSTFFDDQIQKPGDAGVHIASENAAFRWSFFILLVACVIITCGVAPFDFITLDRTLDVRNRINDLAVPLSEAHIITSDCWTCDAKTGILSFTSDFIESDLTNTDERTMQFPVTGVSFNEAELSGVQQNPATFNGIDISRLPSQQTLSASMILGNATKYASGFVVGLPTSSVSTMNVGIYNGDTTTSNSRCQQFITANIYIMYKYNVLVNASDFFVCVCYAIEACLRYNATTFVVV